jgi:hypothetical protein
MSGVAITRTLLANHAPLLALIPANRIFSGQIPQGSVLPAVGVRSISGREHQTTAMNLPTKLVMERIQVTVYGKNFVEMERAFKACSLGRGVYTGTVANFQVRSVLPDYTSPYIGPDGDEIHEQSRDFMVTFIEAN